MLRQRELSQLIQEFVQKYGAMAVERLDGEEVSYDRMQEAVQSISFLEPNKLIVLRTPSKNKDFIERIEAFLQNVADTNQLVIVEPKLDKRLSYYKQLKKHTDFKEYNSLDINALTHFAVEYVRSYRGSLTVANARLLIERVGQNQLTLQHELDKLIAYSPDITLQTIQLMTENTPQSSIFELLDAAFAGNAQRTLQLYQEQRAQQVEPQQIIAMITWQLYIVALVKTAKGRPIDAIAKQAKLSPFVLKKTCATVARLPYVRLQTLVRTLSDLEHRLKTESIIADEAVRYYLLTMCSR